MAQLIGSGGQPASHLVPVLRDLDHLLRVFDAHSDRERFRLHGNAAPMQQAEGITGTMANREDKYTCIHFFATVDYHGIYGFFPASRDFQIRNLRVKPYLAAQANDFVPHVANHVHQDVRSHVRLLFI